MQKVALGQDFLRVTVFPLTVLFHKSSIHIHLSLTDNIQSFISTLCLNNERTKWLGTKMICEQRVVKEREEKEILKIKDDKYNILHYKHSFSVWEIAARLNLLISDFSSIKLDVIKDHSQGFQFLILCSIVSCYILCIWAQEWKKVVNISWRILLYIFCASPHVSKPNCTTFEVQDVCLYDAMKL